MQEPLLFFAIERGNNFHLSQKSCFRLEFYFAAEEVLVVGVSSEVITDRNPATPPCDQLKEAVPLCTTSRPKDIAFTYTVCRVGGEGNWLIPIFQHNSHP